MFWIGFSMALIAGVCGLPAIWRWRRNGVPPWQGMGLRIDARAWADLGIGIAIGGVVMGGVFGVTWAMGALQIRGAQRPDIGWALWLPLLAILAFEEEIFYRSLMLNGLVVVLHRRWLALSVMAACFGLAHAANPHASVLSVLGNTLGGFVYGIAFLGSGRIWLPLGLHFAWNVTQAPVLGFPFFDREIGLVQQTLVGSPLLTGGSYGPEAGLIGMVSRPVTIALLAAWLCWQARRNQAQGVETRTGVDGGSRESAKGVPS